MTRAVLLATLFLTARAHAQVAPEAPSQGAGAKLFEEGRELAKTNKFAEACAKFEQSYALDNGIGTELNLADCHEHLGHFAQAWRLFDDAQQRISDDSEGRSKFAHAHARAAALLSKLATVVVNVADPSLPALSVTVAGRAVKVNGVITERVDPGQIKVEVAQPGKLIYAQTKEADASATAIFDVDRPMVSEGPVPRHHKRVVTSFVVGSAGLAVLVTGIVIGIVADSDYNDAVDPKNGCSNASGSLVCPAGQRDKASSAGSLADVGTIVGVVGVAAIAAGAVLYLTAPKDLVVTPMATNQSAGFAISGRF